MIQLKNISKIYGKDGEPQVKALDNTNLTIKKGEFVAIIGSSGSGKSTMMNILGMLDRPTSGEYFLDNREVNSLTNDELAKIRNRTIGFVFQKFHLLPKTTAVENVELPLYYNSKIRAKERKEIAMNALEAVGLADRMHHTPNQLSGGQQQRVAIARSLVNDPVVILADEATGNLDTRTSYEIMALFQELNSKGKTIVFVTHDPDIAKFTSHNVIFRDGHITREEDVTDQYDAHELLKNLPVNQDYDQL